ncbi:MAG: hypothetical protein HY901_00810, partial [Deltaproteobacteria bacterium]|nr:hypothetical protein [Deltaproteobacteria bacterium]
MTEESEVIESPPAQVELGRVSFPAIARGLVFAVLAIGVVVGIHAYIGARLIAGLQLTGTAAELGWGLVWGLFLTVFAALFARRLPRETAQYLRWVAYGWMGLFALLLVSVAAVDLSSAVSAMAWGRPLAGRWGGLEVAAVGAMALPAFAWGIVRALGPARIERLRVPIAGLPSELEGYRIVQISDLHIGETLGSGWARRVAESVNSLDPDAVAVTGDVADGSPRRVGQ